MQAIAKQHKAERYVKKFTTYNHVVVMLLVALESYDPIEKIIVGMLANTHKLSHLGLSDVVKRSTFSDANVRRNTKVFEDIY